jgi:hypothetical protein
MEKIIRNLPLFIISLIGLIGSIFWISQSGWLPEPVILGLVSVVEIIGFVVLRLWEETARGKSPYKSIKMKQDTYENIIQEKKRNDKAEESPDYIGREVLLDSLKLKKKILFIDDDKNFNVVKILKDSGWKYTRSVTDIKTLDLPVVKESDMLFVDINGVGILLGLENGLDLALMLKQKYPEKKVVIYSANKNSNSFHKAWDTCDYKLEKNALPYQFQNLVEEYSLNN